MQVQKEAIKLEYKCREHLTASKDCGDKIWALQHEGTFLHVPNKSLISMTCYEDKARVQL